MSNTNNTLINTYYTYIMCDSMVNVTLTVPADLKKRMDEFPEINWSEVARQAINQKIQELVLLRSITAKSKLTEENVQEIGDKIKMAIAAKHR